MGFIDILLMILIISGSLYILYRFLFKKKGCCEGCNSTTCSIKIHPPKPG